MNYNWEKFGSKAKAFEAIFKQLKKDEKAIVGTGTSDECRIYIGKDAVILKK
jgi:hypothetical protein